ncbi:MAG: response regulator [Anaerolineales bacterium]|nr:response regulator [Anaerolineales bacterium]
MSDTIRVLIVDDLSETRENVRKLLQFESDIEVIGQAGTGEEAISLAKKQQPDIILMDINMPGIDGIGASQKISETIPRVQIIIMSVQSDPDYLRRAMLAGARDFLTKPFGGDELITAIRRVYAKRPSFAPAPVVTGVPAGAVAAPAKFTNGHVLAVFSPKGGSGCTTVAINMAVSLAKRGYKTILIDGSFQFGDVSVMLNMQTLSSMVDITDRIEDLDAELVSSVVQIHQDSGLEVLLAPPKPEMADVITENHVKRLFETLRPMYDFAIIDTSSSLNEVTLAMLDNADRIVLVTQQTLPSLKNVSRFYDLTDSLSYEPSKIWLMVNRTSSRYGISVKDVASALKRPVIGTIPSEDLLFDAAADQGVPVVLQQNRRQPITGAFAKLVDHALEDLKQDGNENEDAGKSGSIFGRLFGRKSE